MFVKLYMHYQIAFKFYHFNDNYDNRTHYNILKI